jgi:hypothetical protein
VGWVRTTRATLPAGTPPRLDRDSFLGRFQTSLNGAASIGNRSLRRLSLHYIPQRAMPVGF